MRRLLHLTTPLAALVLALAIAPVTLTGCSGGSADEAPAAETDAAEEAEATTDEADEQAADDADETAEDATQEDDGPKAYTDQYGNITARAVDELSTMRGEHDLFFTDVINQDGNGYLFSEDNDRWEGAHGWFCVYDKDAKILTSPTGYDMIQATAEQETGDSVIAVTAVSKEDYPSAKAAYQAIAEDPLGGSERSEFTGDGSWGKGIVWGAADVYLILVGDGGVAWHVDIIPQNALGQGTFTGLTGLNALTYTEGYLDTPEGTII